MKIAMVGPFGLHPNQTMRSRALKLAKPLVAQGHDVTIFMPPWQTPDEADKTWQEDGVTLRYVPLQGGTIGITRHLVKEVLAFQPDVVHCFKPKAYSGLVAWWLWQFHRHKLRIVMDTDDWEGWGGWNDKGDYSTTQQHFFAWQEKWGITHCHALTVASRALQVLAWSMGIPQQQVIYLPNGPGIDVSSGRSLTEPVSVRPPTVLIYSRLFEFEPERLVAILRGVKTAVPDTKFLFVGAGLFAADASQLQQQLQEANLLTAVTDVGWVEPENLPRILCQGDVGIYLMEDNLLNRTKCPVKLADQLALGIPMVGEDVGQVREYVVNGRTGILCPSGDNDAVTAALVQLLQNSELRQELAQNASKHIQANFGWEKLAPKLEQVYEQKTGNKKQGTN